jgi:DNA processing protein
MIGTKDDNCGLFRPTRAALSHLPPSKIPVRIVLNEVGFPAELGSMPQPVKALWYVGRLPDAGDRRLAIVGARAASTAKGRLAHDVAASSARNGFAIVSGGALGIDAAAHRGAIEAGGSTFAILGCGLDVLYPDRHAALYAEVAATGGLISEYEPGTRPLARNFPKRNRIIAALAEKVLVVEAGFASGALITARVAAKLGREVLAIPGSPGTDELIATGAARPIADADALGRVLAGQPPAARVAPARFAALLVELQRGDGRPAELAVRLRLPLADTLALIGEAELDGLICRRPGGALASMERTRGN